MFRALKEAKAALVNALKGLEQTRMTPADDPKLSELKAEIRRTIQEQSEDEDDLNAAA